MTFIGKDGIIEPRTFHVVSERAARWSWLLRERGVRPGRPRRRARGDERRLGRDRARVLQGGRGRGSVPADAVGREPRRQARANGCRPRRRGARRRSRDRADDEQPDGALHRRRASAPRGLPRAGADARLVVPRHRVRRRDAGNGGSLEARRPFPRRRLRRSRRGRALARRRARRRRVVPRGARLGRVDVAHARRAVVARRRAGPPRRRLRPARAARPDLSPRRHRPLPDARRSTPRSPSCGSSAGSGRLRSAVSSRAGSGSTRT